MNSVSFLRSTEVRRIETLDVASYLGSFLWTISVATWSGAMI